MVFAVFDEFTGYVTGNYKKAAYQEHKRAELLAICVWDGFQCYRDTCPGF